MTTTYDPKLHKIVPIEPTEAMIKAGIEVWKNSPLAVVTIYQAMLYAAPSGWMEAYTIAQPEWTQEGCSTHSLAGIVTESPTDDGTFEAHGADYKYKDNFKNIEDDKAWLIEEHKEWLKQYLMPLPPAPEVV